MLVICVFLFVQTSDAGILLTFRGYSLSSVSFPIHIRSYWDYRTAFALKWGVTTRMSLPRCYRFYCLVFPKGGPRIVNTPNYRSVFMIIKACITIPLHFRTPPLNGERKPYYYLQVGDHFNTVNNSNVQYKDDWKDYSRGSGCFWGEGSCDGESKWSGEKPHWGDYLGDECRKQNLQQLGCLCQWSWDGGG